MIKLKDHGESHPVDILHAKDFYARMKAAGVRKASKDDENLNKFLQLDAKFPHLMQMKKVVKALEEVAQVEQKKMQEELAVIASKEGIIEEQENETSEEEEEEVEVPGDKKKVRKSKKQALKGAAKGGKAATNLDLMREAGMGGNGYGYMNDYFAGANKVGGPAVTQKMALLMGGGFTHLNTIEEEKHETQTSNYFREAGGNNTESERDYDATHMRGSHILDDDHSTSKYSPNRHAEGEFEFPGSAKHSGLNQKGSLGAMIPLITPHSTKQTHKKKLNDRLAEGLLSQSKEEVKPADIEEDEDLEEEEDEEYTHQEEEEYEEDEGEKKELESDYEF